MAISSPVSTLMQVYTFPYCPSPVHIHTNIISLTVCVLNNPDSNKGSHEEGSHTYFVAPLPLEGHLPEPNVHDVVIGLGCVTHLTNNVALLHHAVVFILKLTNGATDGLHGAMPCCCV